MRFIKVVSSVTNSDTSLFILFIGTHTDGSITDMDLELPSLLFHTEQLKGFLLPKFNCRYFITYTCGPVVKIVPLQDCKKHSFVGALLWVSCGGQEFVAGCLLVFRV